MNDARLHIIHEAVILFSGKGYHGTSMRDIMHAAGCTQPTLYYYFANKQALFREAVLGEFQRLMNEMMDYTDTALSVKDIYVKAVIRRKHFTAYQKLVYRLAILGWYRLLGDQDVEDQLQHWVQEVMDRCKTLLAERIGDPSRLDTFAALLMNAYLNLTEQIVLKDMDIPDAEINSRLTMLFELFDR